MLNKSKLVRLARLEVKHEEPIPYSIEFHNCEVVAPDDERRGTWLVNKEQCRHTVLFFAASADEYDASRQRYTTDNNVISICVDSRCIDFNQKENRA